MHDGKGKRYSTPYSNFDQLLINGQWPYGKGTMVLNDLSSYNGKVMVEIPHANRDDMDEAYRGAAKAQPEWAALLPGERGQYARAAQIIETRREEIVSWILHESGGTHIKANLEWTTVHGGLLLAKILEEAGLPADVLSITVGADSEIGDAFVTHPIPCVISFIGSTPVGRNIAKLAAEGLMLKRLELELGGNGPFVVLSDANLGQVVKAAVFGKFLHQGQTCMSVNRYIIEDRIHDEFVERFTDRVRRLKVGNPNAPDTMIDLIINESQLNGLQRRINEIISSGAHQIVGGEAQGLVLTPHVFSQVTNQMQLA
jgi:acyl-CoA reductase-like NAD-dependent aldehyde dehydrogenase